MSQDAMPPTLEQLEAVAARLRPRERVILDLASRDRMSNAAIAERLGVSVRTVERLLARVLTKLDLRDRVQAVVLAYETGLVEPNVPESHGS